MSFKPVVKRGMTTIVCEDWNRRRELKKPCVASSTGSKTDIFIRPNVQVNRLKIVQDNWSRRLPLRQMHVASMGATFI